MTINRPNGIESIIGAKITKGQIHTDIIDEEKEYKEFAGQFFLFGFGFIVNETNK